MTKNSKRKVRKSKANKRKEGKAKSPSEILVTCKIQKETLLAPP